MNFDAVAALLERSVPQVIAVLVDIAGNKAHPASLRERAASALLDYSTRCRELDAQETRALGAEMVGLLQKGMQRRAAH